MNYLPEAILSVFTVLSLMLCLGALLYAFMEDFSPTIIGDEKSSLHAQAKILLVLIYLNIVALLFRSVFLIINLFDSSNNNFTISDGLREFLERAVIYIGNLHIVLPVVFFVLIVRRIRVRKNERISGS